VWVSCDLVVEKPRWELTKYFHSISPPTMLLMINWHCWSRFLFYKSHGKFVAQFKSTSFCLASIDTEWGSKTCNYLLSGLLQYPQSLLQCHLQLDIYLRSISDTTGKPQQRLWPYFALVFKCTGILIEKWETKISYI